MNNYNFGWKADDVYEMVKSHMDLDWLNKTADVMLDMNRPDNMPSNIRVFDAGIYYAVRYEINNPQEFQNRLDQAIEAGDKSVDDASEGTYMIHFDMSDTFKDIYDVVLEGIKIKSRNPQYYFSQTTPIGVYKSGEDHICISVYKNLIKSGGSLWT